MVRKWWTWPRRVTVRVTAVLGLGLGIGLQLRLWLRLVIALMRCGANIEATQKNLLLTLFLTVALTLTLNWFKWQFFFLHFCSGTGMDNVWGEALRGNVWIPTGWQLCWCCVAEWLISQTSSYCSYIQESIRTFYTFVHPYLGVMLKYAARIVRQATRSSRLWQ